MKPIRTRSKVDKVKPKLGFKSSLQMSNDGKVIR